MTDILDRTASILERPTQDTFAALRADGLLPATTTETIYVRDAAQVQPSFASLAQIDPRRTHTPGRASLSISGATWFFTNDSSGEASIKSGTGQFSAIFLSFVGLGANRKLIGWFDLRVFGPGSSSLTIGGSGNPSTVVVSNQQTGGARTSVPFAMTATADGRATAYIVGTLNGHGGSWYGTTLWGF